MKDIARFPDTSWLTEQHLPDMGVSKGKGCGWAPSVPSTILNPLYQKAYDRYKLGTYDPSKKPAPLKPDFCKAVLPPLPTRAQACAAKKCAEEFAANCLSSTDNKACKQCILEGAYCDAGERVFLEGICQGAPFGFETAQCYDEIVVDCSSKFTTARECKQCIVLHTPDLKAQNCSGTAIVGVSAMCSKIDSTTPTP
jgi:hypothetical protein